MPTHFPLTDLWIQNGRSIVIAIIGLDMTENRIVTLCRMITWVVFLRMFWNFISSLRVKRGGSLSFLVGTIGNILVMEIGWTDVGSGWYIFCFVILVISYPIKRLGPSWSWSYGSWIYNYLCNQCLTPLTLWVRTPFMVRCTRYNIMW